MTDKIAVVIPYFKRKYFEETLRALANQTSKDFSLYIGDDGSPEDPQDILAKFPQLSFDYQKFTHIGYLHLSQHWDRCIAMTKGEEWILILGDDDIPAENYIETILKIIQNNPENNANVITAKRLVINENSEIVPPNPYNFKSGIQNSVAFYIQKINSLRNISLSEHIFRKSAYERFGFQDFPVAFGTDNIAFLQFTDFKNFYYTEDTFMKVRFSPEHLSSTNNPEIARLRAESMYNSRRFIVENFSNRFSRDEKSAILRNTSKNIRRSGKNPLKYLQHSLFLMKTSGNDFCKQIRYFLGI